MHERIEIYHVPFSKKKTSPVIKKKNQMNISSTTSLFTRGEGHSHGVVESDGECSVEQGVYDTTIHVVAVFVLVAVSFIGTIIPNLTKRFDKRFHFNVVRSFKLIGSGIIISTAIIHMFLPGVLIFEGGCVSELFHSYGAWAGCFCILGFLIAHLVQVLTCCTQYIRSQRKDEESHAIQDHSNLLNRVSLISLEFGIAFHSVLIGVTLGTTTEDFVSLMIAISFHQFFEGLALSSAVSESIREKSNLSFFMLSIYIMSTPFGCLIGIVSRNLLAENVIVSNSIQGILESLSSGILIYNSTVNLLQPLFSSKEYHESCSSAKLCDALFVWLGCIIMAIIGYWA
jgi:zinc transporter 1/2/3